MQRDKRCRKLKSALKLRPLLFYPNCVFSTGERHWGTFNPINAWQFPWVDSGLRPDSEELNNSTQKYISILFQYSFEA